MADRVSGGNGERTMADVRRRHEDQEPSITIRASDPLAVEIMRGIARGLGKNDIKSPFSDMAIRMQAWLDDHKYELIETRVLRDGMKAIENPLGQCVIMVKIGVGTRRDHPSWRVEHRLTGKFAHPSHAIISLYGDQPMGPPAVAEVFDDQHGWELCDSHGDPIVRGGD